jgi:hypothetical protein
VNYESHTAKVSVIAPGGGTGINAAVYAELDQDRRFSVNIVGQSRAHYDCYPEDWAHGSPPPNLQTFAGEVMQQGILDASELLIVGSRGGQVVLPNFWAWGVKVPPTVVINGGCAMKLNTPVRWPDSAITFLLLGGADNFRGKFSHQEYVEDSKKRVPKANSTTAILYVNEMQHMPQAQLLAAVLPHMLVALQAWQERGTAPLKEFRPILAALNRDGWSGRLLHTRAAGVWEDVTFSPCEVSRIRRSSSCSTLSSSPSSISDDMEPIEITKADELRNLWKAAAAAAVPRRESHRGASNFAAVVQAASAQASATASAGRPPKPLLLPVSIGGTGDAKALRGGYTPHKLRSGDPTPISRALGINRPNPSESPKSAYSTGHYEFFITPDSPSRRVAEAAGGGA